MLYLVMKERTWFHHFRTMLTRYLESVENILFLENYIIHSLNHWASAYGGFFIDIWMVWHEGRYPNNLNEWTGSIISAVWRKPFSPLSLMSLIFLPNVTLKSFSNLVYGYARILKPYQRSMDTFHKVKNKIKDTWNYGGHQMIVMIYR